MSRVKKTVAYGDNERVARAGERREKRGFLAIFEPPKREENERTLGK